MRDTLTRRIESYQRLLDNGAGGDDALRTLIADALERAQNLLQQYDRNQGMKPRPVKRRDAKVAIAAVTCRAATKAEEHVDVVARRASHLGG